MNKKRVAAALGLPILVMSAMLVVSDGWGHIGGPPFFDGRMTGGGSVFTGGDFDFFVPRGTRITHGFELHCDFLDLPNNLQVNIHIPDGDDNRFHLEELQFAACWDEPSIAPHPPSAPFDSYFGFGIGRYNGEPGYCADWEFSDAGESGVDDQIASLRIWNCDTEEFVLSILEPGHTLTFGNHQAHRENH